MNGNKKDDTQPTELSPYFQQHASDLVAWYPWCSTALEKAEKDNKLLFISIGYTACHWCKKMALQCFVKNEKIADILNNHFVPILVDKDERPDLDHFYSNAIQLLNENSGWPISCFALSDGTPVFGSTYITPDQLLNIAESLLETYLIEPQKVKDVAKELGEGLSLMRVQQRERANEISKKDIRLIAEPWKRKFDPIYGGTSRPPKFPLAGGKDFLLDFAYYFNDQQVRDHVVLTLDNMAKGGIYDQLHGGFFRYTTDIAWRKPHFEKMMAENALLVSLYSKGFQLTGSPLYRKVIEETLMFCIRELSSFDGGFYTSLAGGDGIVPGAFYTWTANEFDEVLGEDSPLAMSYYGLAAQENSNEQNTLFINTDEVSLAEHYGLSEGEVKHKLATIREKLIARSRERVVPYADDKMVTAINALTAIAFMDAYKSLNNDEYFFMAEETLHFIKNNLMTKDGGLVCYKRCEETRGDGFLDDYAYTALAFTMMYAITGKEQWLHDSKLLVDKAIVDFYDESTGMFFLCPKGKGDKRMQTMPIADGALPSACSVMARELSSISIFYNEQKYGEMAKQMMYNMKPQMAGSGPYCASWARLFFRYVFKQYAVAIVGAQADEFRSKLSYPYRPDVFIFCLDKTSSLPYFEHIQKTDRVTEAFFFERDRLVGRFDKPEELSAWLTTSYGV